MNFGSSLARNARFGSFFREIGRKLRTKCSVFSVCFLSLFVLCVFSLCFLSVFSLCVFPSMFFPPCFLSVFFPPCFLSVFSLSLCVFCLCFLSVFAFYRATKNDTFLSINVDIILLWSGIAGQLFFQINSTKSWWSLTRCFRFS